MTHLRKTDCWAFCVFIIFCGLLFVVSSTKSINAVPLFQRINFYENYLKPFENNDLSTNNGNEDTDFLTDEDEETGQTEEDRGFEDSNKCEDDALVMCDPSSPYRNIDGTCNNLNHPTWGRANECYVRFQPPFYDGYGDFRKSITGYPLPEPREITLNIFTQQYEPSPKVTFMFSLYGLTIAHDISRAVSHHLNQKCCAPENRNQSFCQPIFLKSDDPFYSQFQWKCLGFRKMVDCNICNTTKREQINSVTAALDGSLIYGSNDQVAKELRSNDGTGKLLSNYTSQGEFLPIENEPFGPFCPLKREDECFFSGDNRVNLHATLAALQTVYMREHNRIASKLKSLNPHWDEERLYQEARRLNIAQLQCITFKEYLPALLGPYLMDAFDLSIKNGSDSSKYNPDFRLGIRNEFASAGFRLHSMIASDVGTMAQRFKNMYLNTELIWKGHSGQLMKGMCQVPSERFDRWCVKDITNHLFQPPGKLFGTDLSAIDTQRGRDQGLPPYVDMVRYCSGGRINITSFHDLFPLLMDSESVGYLRKTYLFVEDVDLWVGLQMEYHYPGSEVGPTSVCMIAKQFYFLKFGDRFYFEHEGEVPSFTAAQRKSLKQCSLARMLCDNTHITHLQKNVMLLPSFSNPEIPCGQIPEIDLTPWKESVQAR